METNFPNDESNDNFLSTFINMHLTENIRFYVILLLVKWLIIVFDFADSKSRSIFVP